jgi:hypothetical protein
VRHAFPTPSIALLTLAFAICSQRVSAQNTQNPPASPPPSAQTQTPPQPQPRSPGGDVGSGAGDIGKGTAKGTGKAAEGVGKGAGDLVILHPIDAAGNVGKGAGVAGKDVGVGAAKGTGKITKGTGRGISKIFTRKRPRPHPTHKTKVGGRMAGAHPKFDLPIKLGCPILRALRRVGCKFSIRGWPRSNLGATFFVGLAGL